MSSVSESKPIVIVGAGLTGCCTALLLARRFHNEKFILIESRDDYRKDLQRLEAASLKQQSEMMAIEEENSNENKDNENKKPFGQFDDAASRSINLALSYRGICGLQKAGLWEEVKSRKLLILMKGRYIHNVNNSISIQPYGQGHEGIFSVSRLTLNCMFLDAIESCKNVEIRFFNKLQRINKNGVLTIRETNNNNNIYKLESKFILGCDGAYSGTREALQRLGRYNFAIEYIAHGYKELTIYPKVEKISNDGGTRTTTTRTAQEQQTPSLHKSDSKESMKSSQSSTIESPPVEVMITDDATDESNMNHQTSINIASKYQSVFAMPQNYLHIWPRDEFMLIGLPNPDKTFTCTLFAPWNGENGLTFLENATENQVRSYFEANYPDFVKLCPNYYDFWLRNPASPLAHIHLNQWNFENKILLLGDAAHAIVPFYGQGMNAGFEDTVILDELFDKYFNNNNSGQIDDNAMKLIEKVFDEFSKIRQPSCEALSKLSLQNYVEMRSLTGKKWFLYKKKFETMLNYVSPSMWRPIYSMVSFSRTPYDKAMERADKQDKYLGLGLGLLTGVTAISGYLLANKYYQANGKKWPWNHKRSNM